MALQAINLPGWQRFDYFLQPLQAVMTKAETSGNPALYLYQQNIRTPLFMLEALTRLYRDMHNAKLFEKLNERFKSFEDLLGAIDYYDGFGKEFSARENIPDTCKEYIKNQMENKLGELNRMLDDGSWIGRDNKRIKKIYGKLGNARWREAGEDSAGIRKFYGKSILAITASIRENHIRFRDVEKDVHELRRELRWLSIYPQALRGLIQMKPTVDSPGFLDKYLTPEILNSPFNKMPGPGSPDALIYVNGNYFYALSWLIAELGKLKDNGLRIVILKEALLATGATREEEAVKQALGYCGEGQMSIPEILDRAREISLKFFEEKILQQLVVDA